MQEAIRVSTERIRAMEEELDKLKAQKRKTLVTRCPYEPYYCTTDQVLPEGENQVRIIDSGFCIALDGSNDFDARGGDMILLFRFDEAPADSRDPSDFLCVYHAGENTPPYEPNCVAPFVYSDTDGTVYYGGTWKYLGWFEVNPQGLRYGEIPSVDGYIRLAEFEYDDC